MEERTTKELILTLGHDVDRCHSALIEAIDKGETDEDGNVDADYEYHARQLIRSILAYIEAVTFSVKVTCVDKCLEAGIEVSDYERYLAVELDGDLSDNGEVIERPARIRLINNIRFAFRLLEKASNKPSSFDTSLEWWSCLRKTICVRDRLMHPRMPKDIDISGDEIVNSLEAMKGFTAALLQKDEDNES